MTQENNTMLGDRVVNYLAQYPAVRQNKLDKLQMKIGDTVHVMTIGDEWHSGTITSISTGCDNYVYDHPIAWVTGICGEGEALFTEADLELRDGQWWEKV